jgi:HlyD family secretion protein
MRTVEPAGFSKISALGVEEQRVWIIADPVTLPEAWRFLGDSYRDDRIEDGVRVEVHNINR